MTELINELDGIIRMADTLKQRAIKARKKLASVDSPASRKGRRVVLSESSIESLVMNRNKTIHNKMVR